MALCCWCSSALVREAVDDPKAVLFVCPTPACRAKQLEYALMWTRPDKRGKPITSYLYLPTPRQVDFHAATAPHVLFGGAAGPGKSHALRWDAYVRCLQNPGYEALLLRRTFPELMKTHIRRAGKEVPCFGAQYLISEHTVKFDNGSELALTPTPTRISMTGRPPVTCDMILAPPRSMPIEPLREPVMLTTIGVLTAKLAPERRATVPPLRALRSAVSRCVKPDPRSHPGIASA